MEKIELFEALQEDALAETAARINQLPRADDYKNTVEKELWEYLTDIEYHQEDTIPYEELPKRSQELIGYEDIDSQTIPWWLQDFEWTVFFVENDSLVLNENTLPDFVDRHGGDTYLQPPELNEEDGSVYSVLEQLHKLHDRISDETDLEIPYSEVTEPFALPSSGIFEGEGKLKTTLEYHNWLRELIALCPPFDHTTTALLYANSGIKHEYFTGLAPVPADEVTHITNILSCGSVDLIIRGIFKNITEFDGEFDYELQSNSESLPSLEELVYRSWEIEKGYTELIKKAETSDRLNDQTDYAGRILLSPLKINANDKVQFATFAYNKYSYSGKEGEKAKIISNILLENK